MRLASPLVEVAADTAQAAVGIRERQLGSYERLFRLKNILAVVPIDAGDKAVNPIVVRIEAQAEVTTPAKRGTDDTARLLRRLAIEGNHHFGMTRVRVTHAIMVLHHQHTRAERLGNDTAFSAPTAVEMGNPDIALVDRQETGGIAEEGYGLLLAIGNLAPGFDDIQVLVRFVKYFHGERIDAVLEGDGRRPRILLLIGKDVLDYQVERHIAIGVLHQERRLVLTQGAEGGISLLIEGQTGTVDILHFITAYLLSVIGYLQCFVLRGGEEKRRVGRGNQDILLPAEHRGCGQQARSRKE